MSDVDPVHCRSIDQLQLPVDVPALSDKPNHMHDEMLEILDKLKLVKWEEFAVHLFGVTQSLIDRIKKGNHLPKHQKKMFVLEWLMSRYASWRDVLIALNKAQEDELFVTVLYNLAIKPPCTKWTASSSKDDVIANATKLCQVFTELLVDIKGSLSKLVHQQIVNSLSQIAGEIGKYLEIDRMYMSQLSSIDELFIEIQPYCTYLNCELIEHLINKIPKVAKGKNVMERLRKYFQELQQFCESSPLLYLTEALKRPVCTITSTTADVSLRLSSKWNQLSLHNLLRAIQYWFGSERLYLNYIVEQNGCLDVKFITPRSHVQSLQSLAVANSERLHQLGVVEMHINGVSVIGKEELENFEATCLRAAEAGDCSLILLLLELGVSLNCTNEEGQTPLMVAVFNEQLQAIYTLVYTGADASISDINGYTALTTALKIKNIKPDIIELLLHALHIEPAQQMSLFQLCTEDNSEKLEHFLSTSTDVDINYQTPGGVTALMIASVFRWESVVDVLLKYNADIGTRAKMGWTALLFARHHGHLDLFPKATELHEAKEAMAIPTIDDCTKSAEYNTLKERFAKLVDLLAGNVEVIPQLSNHFFSLSVIPQAVHQNNTGGALDRATRLFNSALATVESHSNPNSVFSNIIQSLMKVGLTDMATTLVNCLGNNGGHISSIEVSSDSMQSHPAATCTIQLSSKDEVAKGFNILHNQFTDIVVKLMDQLKECVNTGSVSLDTIVNYTGQFLKVQQLTKASTITELFDSIMLHYDFFNYDVIEALINKFLSSEDELQTKLAQYTESVEKFEELSQLKHIQSVISEKLPVISDNENTSKVVIKLNGRWSEMTMKNLRSVLVRYFGSDTLVHHIRITQGSVCVTLLATAQSQSLIDKVTSKTDSMKLIGVFEMCIDTKKIFKEKEDDIDFEHSLRQSASTGKSFETSILLQLGANPNGQDEQGNTALILATEGEHTEVLKSLVAAGADISKPNNEGRTVLMIASEKNNRELMESLLEANTVQQQKHQIEQLLESFLKTKAGLEEALVESKGEIALLQEKISLLSLQLKERERNNCQLPEDNQSFQCQRLLTERDREEPFSVKSSEQDIQNKTIQENNMIMMKCLLAPPYIQQTLTLACENGDYLLIESLLKRNVDVDIQLPNGSTPLILASQNGHHTVVKLLLEAKADCNVKDREGTTTLIASSQGGHYKVTELLVQQQQTEFNSVDKNGYTALHHACQNGSIEIVSLLLEKKAISHSCTNNGSTALMLASQHGHLPIIELLFSYNKYCSRYEGLEALSVADSPEIVHLLADKCNISKHSTLTIEKLKTVAKREMKKQVTGRVDCHSNRVRLYRPSVQQCREVIANLKDNHQIIDLSRSSSDIVLLLLPPVLQRETIKQLVIWDTSLTLQCIQSLSYLLIANKSLEMLELHQSAITDELLDYLCVSLQHNYTLTSLGLYSNNGITSDSAQSLSSLLLTNSTLTKLDLVSTSFSSDGVTELLYSLTENKTLEKLILDRKHKTTCHQHSNYTLIRHRLDYYR